MDKVSEEEQNQNRFIAQKGDFKIKVDGQAENIAAVIQRRNEKDLELAMKKHMPIGSVVKLKESFKKYMVIGYNTEFKEELYDYLGCEYPYGVRKDIENKGFNHGDIDNVYSIGFFNDQARRYQEELMGEKEER